MENKITNFCREIFLWKTKDMKNNYAILKCVRNQGLQIAKWKKFLKNILPDTKLYQKFFGKRDQSEFLNKFRNLWNWSWPGDKICIIYGKNFKNWRRKGNFWTRLWSLKSWITYVLLLMWCWSLDLMSPLWLLIWWWYCWFSMMILLIFDNVVMDATDLKILFRSHVVNGRGGWHREATP